MASHAEHNRPAADEQLQLSPRASVFAIGLLVVGVVAILAALGISMATEGGLRRFYHAYLTNYAYFLSITLGGMFFVLIHHLTRAGWSVSIRRIAEALASTIPFMAVLAVPLVVAGLSGKGLLYSWAMPLPDHPAVGSSERAEMIDEAAHDRTPPADDKAHPESPQAHSGPNPEHDTSPEHKPDAPAAAGEAASHGPAQGDGTVPAKGVTALTMGKRVYLNPMFWTVRVAFYFAVWSVMALFYWRQSRRQDENGDLAITERLAAWAGPLLVIFGLTVSFAAFDIVMSLDPDWYSTMFGVYYFAGGANAMFATLIVVAYVLQRLGYLQESLSREHYHDLGKWLFAFVFFWGYVSFSQYMLIWYANLPETTYWFANRGATTNPDTNITAWGWSIVMLMILFGRLLIPFGGLMSRHVKRNQGTLVFWAVWILVFHWVDTFWMVMPEYSRSVTFGLPEILGFIGVGGVVVGGLVWRLSAASLRPLRDPRLSEALAFHNF